jgi:AcrR family transcriptional regulator
MTEQPGLRERKKLQTRRAILDAAVRLFEEKGYEQTTVSEIAAAADVATKTVFNYFPSKEDLFFSDHRRRSAIMQDLVESRRQDETLAELIERLRARLVAMVAEDSTDWRPELAELRYRLISEVPALQARALKLTFDIQREVADALHKAYGDRLDRISAAAVVGILVGAAQATGLASLQLGETLEQRRESSLRGLDIAMRGIRSVSEETGRG